MRHVRNNDKCSREDKERISRSREEGDSDFRYSKNVLSGHPSVEDRRYEGREKTHNHRLASRYLISW
jgi:hypothetical protein